VRVVLVVFDAFAALTAIGGGIALIMGLESNRFPLEMLRGTPFSSYTMPALLLSVGLCRPDVGGLTFSPLSAMPIRRWAT
jgi:hypothetical protein